MDGNDSSNTAYGSEGASRIRRQRLEAAAFQRRGLTTTAWLGCYALEFLPGSSSSMNAVIWVQPSRGGKPGPRDMGRAARRGPPYPGRRSFASGKIYLSRLHPWGAAGENRRLAEEDGRSPKQQRGSRVTTAARLTSHDRC
ncbi:hypothetical protein ACCO45_008268 [Purpureocillium lilacinum]|uniref:Uncharacterized protein n=1 Tax=Purpureocillium lilacinum TaxID=33203 RepID=A0ACC4DMT0_PURLI